MSDSVANSGERLNRNPSKIDMLNGPLLGKILIFALPLAAGNILQQLFNAVDLAVVGRFASSDALAAVGANTTVVACFVNIFVGVSLGANVVIANFIGQNRYDRISDAVHTSIAMGIGFGLILTLLGLGTARPIMVALGTPENILEPSILYLRIYVLGMPFIMLYNFGSAVLRSIGDTRRPLYCLIAAGFLNAILNVIFVVGFGRGVDGVAAATVLSNVVSGCMVVIFLLRETEPVRLHLNQLKLDREIVWKSLVIGVPAGLQGMVFSLSNTLIQAAINSYGSAAVAGTSISLNCDLIAYFALSGFVQSTVTFTAQNYGAGQLKRCRKICRLNMICGLVLCLIASILFISFKSQVVGLFTTDLDVALYAEQRIIVIMIPYMVICSYEIGGASLRGIGHSMAPSVLTIIGTCILRVSWAWFLDPLFHNFTILMMVYPASWGFTGLLVLIAYFVLMRKEEKAFEQANREILQGL